MPRSTRVKGSEPRNMMNTTGASMRWSVLWYVSSKDIIVRKRFGNNLTEAINLYELAKRAGKEQVTLRCDNVGFPPPQKWLPHVAYIEHKEVYTTPKGKRKYRVVNKAVHRTPMEKANKANIYWCPYCREFRKFQKQRGFMYDGQWVPDPDRRGGWYCPMCGVSHRDMHVRRYNPLANIHYLSN